MKFAIRYYTKTGNTKKLAEALAKELDIEAKDLSHPIDEDTDILFFGSSVYAAGVDPQVKTYIKSLDNKVKEVVAFSTAAILTSTFNQVKKLFAEEGIQVNEKEFHCRGNFKFMHKNKPDENDLNNIKVFVKQFK